jgi:peptidoglycan hydrolase-like amidase
MFEGRPISVRVCNRGGSLVKKSRGPRASRKTIAAMMFVVAAVLAGLALGGWLLPCTARAAGNQTFVFQGNGYGHGAGMSQWGAWQKARDGETWDQILAFYYPNTTVVDNANIELKVKISPSVTSWAQDYSEVQLTGTDLSSAAAPMTLITHDAGGDHTQEIPAGFFCVIVRREDGSVYVTTPTAQEGPFDWAKGVTTVDGGGNAGRIKIRLRTASGLQAAKEYWGSMQVTKAAAAGYLNVYNYVLLENYTRSIAEVDPAWAKASVPASYAPEAVKAQAVAARTWGVFKMNINGWFNDNTRDVAYAGYTWEANNPGVAQAAADTAGKVVFYNGSAISSNFSAHNGGYTSANPWGYSTPAYWRVGPDPASLKAPPWRPAYSWKCSVSAATLSTVVNDYLIANGGSGLGNIYRVRVASRDVPSDPGSHARTMELVGTLGTTIMQAETFRYLIPTDPATGDNMRSTLFTKIVNPYNTYTGSDRYATAIMLSQSGFPSGAPAAVLTSGLDFPGALVGAPLAGAFDSPLLLTPNTILPKNVAAELKRLNPAKVFIIGLPASFVGKVQAALPGLAVGQAVLLTGSDRYQTAATVALVIKAKLGSVSGVIIAPGDKFPDGLAAAPLGASKGWPILLTPAAGPFPKASADAIVALGVTTGIEVGTYAAPGVPGFTLSKRMVGTDRYHTCAMIAEYGLTQGMSFTHLAVTTGEKFPDALASGPFLALDGGTLLLTPLTGVSPYTAASLAAHKAEIGRLDFIGLSGPVLGKILDLIG